VKCSTHHDPTKKKWVGRWEGVSELKCQAPPKQKFKQECTSAKVVKCLSVCKTSEVKNGVLHVLDPPLCFPKCVQDGKLVLPDGFAAGHYDWCERDAVVS
jgi:hypothetical protein